MAGRSAGTPETVALDIDNIRCEIRASKKMPRLDLRLNQPIGIIVASGMEVKSCPGHPSHLFGSRFPTAKIVFVEISINEECNPIGNAL